MTLWDQTLLGLFQKGSFVMWPLLLCSIIGTAVIFERGIYYARIHLNYEKFRSDLKSLLQKGDLPEVQKFCRKKANPIPRLTDCYLKHLHDDALRNDILKREGSFALEKIETRLRVLAALTHITPILGLLGTVTGLVGAFHQIELLGGQVQPADLAGGIWEALITTVFGLIIAIPCMAAYHGFESIADRVSRRMQFVVSELDEFFSKHSVTEKLKADSSAQAMNMVQ